MNLTLREKAAYGLGAVGKDMVYMLSASYVLYYFQDVLGVSAVAMGVILLVARIFDAFNDPIMGVIVAKTKTRWGKFRPWLLIGTITNAAILIMMFSAPPSLDGGGMIAYAAVTYILWGVTYTMMDIPYWSMIPAFTRSGREREGLSALARSCAGVGSALVTIITVMAVSALGSAMVGSSTDNTVMTISNSDKNVSAFLIEVDGDKNPTGNVKNLTADLGSGLVMSAEISGSDKVFEKVIHVNPDNADVKISVNGTELEDASAELVMDSRDSAEAVFAIFVNAENYKKLSETGDFHTEVTFSSTLEVERVGFKYFSIVIGVLFVIFIIVTCVCIKEKSSVDMQTASVGQMFNALVHNDQAMTIVITIVLVNTATYITSNLLIYFFKYDLAGSNWQGNYTLFNTFAGGMQIIAMMALFPLLRKLFSTLKVFYICVFSAIGGYLILLAMALSGTKSVFLFFVPGFFIMAAVGILNVIVTIFLANTVDYGEYKNNRRDESVIFSMQTFVVKLASGIAAMVASICLTVFNIQESSTTELSCKTFLEKIADYESHTTETIGSGAVAGLRLVMTLTPIVVLIIALVIFKAKYILTDEKLTELTQEIAKRKEANM